jgi:hypothetical protein
MADERFDPSLDRRAVLRALLLGAAGAGTAALAACGLPSGSRPIVDGPAPTGRSDTGDAVVNAPVPEDAAGPVPLVQGFFGAVAGRVRLDADFAQADQRAQAFLDATARKAWPAGKQSITVVRVLATESSIGDTFGSTFVDVQVKPTGVLQVSGGVSGAVDPLPGPTTSEPRKLRFTVVSNGSDQYLIHGIQVLSGSPLEGMMLDSSYLSKDFYTPQLIYFWSADTRRKGLVPDIRYVPKPRLSKVLQLTEIVDWVLNGPSDLIKDVVQGGSAYSGLAIVGPNLTAPGKDGLLVNLTDQPQGLQPDDVMQQLRWSLRPLYEDAVRLQYNGQQQSVDGSSNRFRDVNLADEKYRPLDTRYYVAGGMVRNYDSPTDLPDVLEDPDVNKDVALAALNKSLTFTALVKKDGYLWIGDGTSAKPALVRAQLPQSQSWTRPVFLPTLSTRVLVGQGGLLYVVAPNGSATQLVTGFPVSAFAVAPDGHRLAVISGGAASVWGLKIGKNDDISLGVGSRNLDADLTDCTGIAWTGLDRVLVAGKLGNGYQLAEVTIDGAIADLWAPVFSTPVTSVVALPQLPWVMVQPESGQAMVQQGGNGGAFTAASYGARSLTLPTTQTPTPTGSPSTAPANLGTVSYPFYADYGT